MLNRNGTPKKTGLYRSQMEELQQIEKKREANASTVNALTLGLAVAGYVYVWPIPGILPVLAVSAGTLILHLALRIFLTYS